MPEPIDLSALFGQSPEEIVQAFRDKDYEVSFNWRDVWEEANAQAFTVSRLVEMDVLQSVHDAVTTSLEEGQTFREFQQELEPELRAKGWWGENEVVNEQTGEVVTTRFTPWRLKTIYRTNLQTSYMGGRWKSQQNSSRPYLEYIAINDPQTRESHRARDGVVLRKDDPWWDENYPPNGWGCRCRTRTLSERQVERRGINVASEDDVPQVAEEGWQYNPGEAQHDPDLDNYEPQLREDYLSRV